MLRLETGNKKSVRCHWPLISNGEESDKTKKQHGTIEFRLVQF